MRVIARFRPYGRDDRGAVMIFFAAFLIAACGLLALVIDLGASRDARRRLVNGTDAAALAAASEYATVHGGSNGCNADEDDDGVVEDGEMSIAEEQLVANSGAAVMDFCGVTPGPVAHSGLVTVSAHEEITFVFGPVVGDDEGTAYSSTTVVYGIPSSVEGLKPIGLCGDHVFLQQWLAAGSPTPSQQYVIKFHENSNQCGSAPGNWALLEYPDVPGYEDTAWNTYAAVGYPGLISIGDQFSGQTGAPSGGSKDPTVMMIDGQPTTGIFPIVDFVSGTGTNATYEVSGFVKLSIEGVVQTGQQEDRHMKVRFIEGGVEGTCCSSGPSFGTVAYQICGVDDDPSTCP